VLFSIVSCQLLSNTCSSFAVDNLIELAEDKGYGIAYIYLQYQDSERQTPIHILKCLLKQLAEQNSEVWKMTKSLRDRLTKEHKVPSAPNVEVLLHYALSRFSRVFIALDALDETHDMKTLKPLLESISKLKAAGAEFILTSRHDSSLVRDAMASEMSSKVELQPSYEDMKAYIEDYIDRDPQAKRLIKADVRPGIVESLTAGANGM
jgi:hypothetical protein